MNGDPRTITAPNHVGDLDYEELLNTRCYIPSTLFPTDPHAKYGHYTYIDKGYNIYVEEDNSKNE